jgi:hypothetical protein
MYRPSMYKPPSPLARHKYRLLGGGIHVEPAQASEMRASAETSDCPTWTSVEETTLMVPYIKEAISCR